MKTQLQVDYSALCDALADKLPEIFDRFGVKGKWCSNGDFQSTCYLHGGDNPTAFHYKAKTRRWSCFTHACQRQFKSSLLGLLRGLLAAQSGSPSFPFPKAVQFAQGLVGDVSLGRLRPDLGTEDSGEEEVSWLHVPRETVRASLHRPCEYLINRGFSAELQDEFDVGVCLTKGRRMFQRAVFPIYDDGRAHMIGCTGRSIHEQCEHCGCYHNPIFPCPEPQFKGLYAKWRNNKGLPKDKVLYNFERAAPFIREAREAILLEGPLDVLRAWEAGYYNVVGMMGVALCDGQVNRLFDVGCGRILVGTDNDDAGHQARQQIFVAARRFFKVRFIDLSYNKDVGAMSTEDVRNMLG